MNIDLIINKHESRYQFTVSGSQDSLWQLTNCNQLLNILSIFWTCIFVFSRHKWNEMNCEMLDIVSRIELKDSILWQKFIWQYFLPIKLKTKFGRTRSSIVLIPASKRSFALAGPIPTTRVSCGKIKQPNLMAYVSKNSKTFHKKCFILDFKTF